MPRLNTVAVIVTEDNTVVSVSVFTNYDEATDHFEKLLPISVKAKDVDAVVAQRFYRWVNGVTTVSTVQMIETSGDIVRDVAKPTL